MTDLLSQLQRPTEIERLLYRCQSDVRANCQCSQCRDSRELGEYMTADVIDIHVHKPRLSGEAKCMGCGYKWAAVAPVGTTTMDCPECEAHKGAFVNYAVRDAALFVCDCGNDLYFIHPDGANCAHCGVKASGY